MKHRSHTLIATAATICGSVLATVVMAALPTLARGETSSAGYIEICKTFRAGPAGTPAYQGTFRYHITDGRYQRTITLSAVQGGPQVCTAPLAVPVGTATVTELAAPWSSVVSITPTQGDPGTVTLTGVPGQAALTVNPAPSPGDTSLTTTVQYTNDPVTGVVEVCKQAAANSQSLTGTYQFNVTTRDWGVMAYDSANGLYDIPWGTTAAATISGAGLGCSGPIVVPAGLVQTVEPGTTSVTAITATSNGKNELVGAPNLAFGTAVESVLAGTTTNQTIVTYTDALATVKLCKQWTNSADPPTLFPFAASSSGPAGPTAVMATAVLAPGQCQIIGTVRPGTQVNISEGIVPGTKVASIGVNPTANSQGMSPIVPGSLSLPNRTVSIIAGAGETDVTFTDMSADPGTLKVCVAPTANPSAGTATFTIDGAQTIDVNLSSTALQCTVDLTPFAFDSSVTIAGGALPSGDAFTGAPVVVPSNVEVLEGGVPTPTNQPSLAASTASSATVVMSEGIVTEITFAVDPPAPATAPPTTVISPSTPVVTPAPTLMPAPVVTPIQTVTPTLPVVTLVSNANAPAATPTSPVVPRTGISAQAVRLRKQLVRVRAHARTVAAEVRTLTRRLHSRQLSKAARMRDRRTLAHLRGLEHRLAMLEHRLAREIWR